MMEASVVDIKRLAVHDGPGIRTTVFLKGCSLSCKWCHNPESLNPSPQLGFRINRCTHCGECVCACPNKCHSFSRRGEHIINRRNCVSCGKCVQACFHDALVLYGRRFSCEEVLNIVLEDRYFYEYSGGGVTVSGGEPLLQSDFCKELLFELQKEGIHCAVDTSGFVPWDRFEEILPETDLFLYDIKHIDSREHEIYMGMPNEVILENLCRLTKQNKPIVITMPLIPGINSSETQIRNAGKFLSGLKNICGLKLVPYRDLARSKYAALGLDDTMPHVSSPEINLLARTREFLLEEGISNVTFNDEF